MCVHSCSSISQFSDFVQDLLVKEGNLSPIGGNIFDYYLDLKTVQLIPWKERRKERTEQGKGSTRYVQLPEVQHRHECTSYMYMYIPFIELL